MRYTFYLDACPIATCDVFLVGFPTWKLTEFFGGSRRCSWQGDTLYLHTDDDPAAFGLYTNNGYVVRKEEKVCKKRFLFHGQRCYVCYEVMFLLVVVVATGFL